MTQYKAVVIMDGGRNILLRDFGEDVELAEEFNLTYTPSFDTIAIGDINGDTYTIVYYKKGAQNGY